MDELEKRLDDLEVPILENDPFQHELRRQLVTGFIPHRTSGRLILKFGTALVLLLALFGVATMVNPGWAYKFNNFAFQNDKGSEVEKLDLPDNLSDLPYTSINNPHLKDQLDAKQYVEDKSYVIRKYKSRRNGEVMIVSEYDDKGKRVKTRLVNQKGM
ncbi:MAG: hypothetical protein P9L91_03110 [Candidatus Zophobacter franzmannii]|nr:hypothetical protein [Candidatus Zophobacter franzmannii]